MKNFLFGLFCAFISMPFLACGSTKEVIVLSQTSTSVAPHYLDEARRVGKALADHQLRLVTMACPEGTFLQFIEGAMEGNGDIVVTTPLYSTVRPELQTIIENHLAIFSLKFPTIPVRVNSLNNSMNDEINFSTKAVIVFPGGLGAAKRFLDIALEKTHTGENHVKLIVYNYDHFWDGLISQIKHMFKESFTRYLAKDHFEVVHSIEELDVILSNIETGQD